MIRDNAPTQITVASSGQTAGPVLYFGLLQRELFLALYGSFFSGAVFALLFPEESIWSAGGLSITVFIIFHIYLTCSRYVILPGLMSLVACINWIVFPWIAYHYPPSFRLYTMTVPQEQYFSYAVPAMIALWLGAHLMTKSGLLAAGSAVRGDTLTPREQRFMDWLIVFGLGLTVLESHLPQSVAFFFYILAKLRFVGAMAWMLSGTRGWAVRVTVVYFHLLVQVAGGGVFFEFILWSGFLLIFMAYAKQWKAKLIAALLVALLMGGVLNSIKPAYRLTIAGQELGSFEKVQVLGKLFWNSMTGSADASYTAKFSDSVVRFNQGWIIARIMTRVPDVEPYGNGNTILNAVAASIVPRAFFPDKEVVSSRALFARYTGLKLRETTSMTLGIAGEMYANFGPIGGVAAVFVYGLLVGWMFARFARIARDNPFWWAWVPFVMIAAIEADWNLVDILNYLIKAFIVMWVLMLVLPRWDIRLFNRSGRVDGPESSMPADPAPESGK